METVENTLENNTKENENKNERYNNNIDKMKQVIRINFEHDTKNELLGFMEVETEAQCDGIHEDYFHPGQVIVFYRSNTMELTFQDMKKCITPSYRFFSPGHGRKNCPRTYQINSPRGISDPTHFFLCRRAGAKK